MVSVWFIDVDGNEWMLSSVQPGATVPIGPPPAHVLQPSIEALSIRVGNFRRLRLQVVDAATASTVVRLSAAPPALKATIRRRQAGRGAAPTRFPPCRRDVPRENSPAGQRNTVNAPRVPTPGSRCHWNRRHVHRLLNISDAIDVLDTDVAASPRLLPDHGRARHRFAQPLPPFVLEGELVC